MSGLINKDSCLAGLSPPSLKEGQTMDGGVFYRNLQKNHLSRIYLKKPTPQRLKKPEKWSWNDAGGNLALSVNEKKCSSSPPCSILISENSEQFVHVWELDLAVLNQLLTEHIGAICVAMYIPVGANRCHFEIVSFDGQLSDVQIQSVLNGLAQLFPPKEKGFPKGKSVPKGTEQEFQKANEIYSSLINLHCEVLAE